MSLIKFLVCMVTAIPQFVSITTSSVIVTALATLIVGVAIGSITTYHIMKRKALRQQWKQQQMDGTYEVVANVGAINRTFEMEENVAYGPTRSRSS